MLVNDPKPVVLDKRWVAVARLLWVGLALLGLYLILRFIPLHLDQLTSGTAQQSGSLLQFYSLSSSEILILQQAGLSPSLYARLVLVMELTWILIFCLPSALIIIRRSGDRMALFASFALLLQGLFTTPLIFITLAYNPTWRIPVDVLAGLGLASLISLFYLFPDGRFVPSWTRAFLGLAYILAPGITLWASLNHNSPFRSAFLIILGPFGLLIAAGIYSQIYRYRRVSTITQRQQTKWFMLSMLMMALGILLIALITMVFQVGITTGRNRLLYLAISLPLNVLSVALIPLSISFAVMRYRLWDIDLIIRRTLVYSLLTTSLVLVYFSSVVLLQTVVSSFLKDNLPLVTVASTLSVAALFTPLRRRIQQLIDRRFYRQKYNAEQVLAAFSTVLRDEVDLNQLTEYILEGVDETLQPVDVWIWLKDGHSP